MSAVDIDRGDGGPRPGRPRGIVVVGGGIAGQAVVEAVREHDSDVPITLVCAEPCLPYDRQRLSELLGSGSRLETLLVRPPEWFDDHAVSVRIGRRVVAIDSTRRHVVLDDGSELTATHVVLATGSDPFLPPIPGLAELAGVHVFRGPQDCTAILAAVASGIDRVVVIGGGLLGLEAARGIADHGCATTVVHLADRLMERQLDRGAADLLLPAFAALGVDVRLGTSTTRLLDDGDGAVGALELAGGERIDARLVVVATGISPQVELARSAGLEVRRGVVVDDQMRTSAPGILAVGECAEHEGVVHGLVAPILEQARVAGRTLSGDAGAVYRGSIPSAKLKVAGIDLVAIGEATGAVEALTTDAPSGTYRKLVVRDGIAVGAVLLGDIRGAEALLAAVRAGDAVPDALATLVAAAEAGPEDLPDAAPVCDCNGVCKGQILDAVREGGARTAREVMTMTRAGTGCGSCRSLVIDLVALATGGAVEEPAYLCPCRRQTREALATRIRDDGLRSVSEVATACATGRDCGACKPALAYLVSEINANRHREERHARYINDRVHANIQKDGTFSVVPRMYGGVTTPAELRRIADVAERYAVPMVKVTGGQRLDLLGVRKDDLPKIWAELGMPSGHAYAKAVRTVKTCVGSDFCRFGIGDSIALGQEAERLWEGLHTPAKVKSGVSGCPRNCAEATVKDIGFVAVDGGWQVRVGGAAGATVREADVLCTVETRAEALRVATTFLQYYREHGEYKERTYDFVPRIGLDTIRDVVLDEVTGAALRERLRLAKAAVVDPWLERGTPHHPRQFTDLDGEPMLVGPPPQEGRA